MTFAVLGPGAVGTFVAAALARSGQGVMIVARPKSAAAIIQHGLAVESDMLGRIEARPPAIAELPATVDVLIVTTKAPALAAALERVRATPRLVVPLLNGIEHLALLRERFGDRVVPATMRIDARREAPGRVTQHGENLLVELVGAPGLAAVISHAGIPARSFRSEPDVMWRKLVRLCPLAITTSAFDCTLGEIRDNPARRADLDRCIDEVCAVARADGAAIDAATPRAELEAAHSWLSSSLRRDVRAGAESELDAIAGAVLRAGARHGLDCPTVARLAARIDNPPPCSSSSSVPPPP